MCDFMLRVRGALEEYAVRGIEASSNNAVVLW